MGRGRRKKKNRSVVPAASSSVHLSESKPKPPSSPMACLICFSYADVSFEYADVQFYGFILDPAAEAAHKDGDGDGDGEGLMPLNPRFRLDGLSLAAFCIVNSILYVFESTDGSDDLRKSVYSLDLSSVLNESSSEMVVIEKGMLEKCAEMEDEKFGAVAILTPKGKILVFSVRYTSSRGFGYGGAVKVDFELFDPDTKQCRPLPRLPNTSGFSDVFCINGYGFLSDTLFMVYTNEGKFTFDFDRNNGWEDFKSSYEPGGHFVGLGNELYTTYGLIRKRDHNDERFVLDPPLTRFPDSVNLKLIPYEDVDDLTSRISYSSSICLLDVAEKEYTLCIARVVFASKFASGKGSEQPCVIFDAYKCDLAQLDQKTKASFRFMVCIPGELFAFDSSALYRVD